MDKFSSFHSAVNSSYLLFFVNFHPEIAAWLAENGPVSVALNAFAMQVTTKTTKVK